LAFYGQKRESIYGYPTLRYGKEAGCKRFMEAVLWMARVVLLCHVQARVIVMLRGVDGEELLGVNPE
jgi:hypothetical protein